MAGPPDSLHHPWSLSERRCHKLPASRRHIPPVPPSIAAETVGATPRETNRRRELLCRNRASPVSGGRRLLALLHQLQETADDPFFGAAWLQPRGSDLVT